MKNNLRKIALSILYDYEASDKYINLALSSHSLDSLDDRERALLTSLVYTTVERKLTYDYYISAISKRSDSSIDPYTKNILRLGLCQLLDINSIPDFAAVNESVNLARNPGERAFVNGVLFVETLSSTHSQLNLGRSFVMKIPGTSPISPKI